MARRRLVVLRIVIVFFVLALAAYLSRTLWLGALGRALVEDDGPAKADAVAVLGGDPWGMRLETAARLVREGFAPVVLISGSPGPYGTNEADLAIAYIVRRGYPVDWFVPLRNEAMSTREESFLLLRELRQRNLHSVILVTSDFHTARAARTFRATERALGWSLELRMVAAPDRYFHAATWWRNRESCKITLGEWEKTVANALGM